MRLRYKKNIFVVIIVKVLSINLKYLDVYRRVLDRSSGGRFFKHTVVTTLETVGNWALPPSFKASSSLS